MAIRGNCRLAIVWLLMTHGKNGRREIVAVFILLMHLSVGDWVGSGKRSKWS